MRRIPGRLLLVFALVAGVAVSALPVPVAAHGSPRPLLGYSPAFVTERQAGRWVDCLWASSAMLLDKWTNGSEAVSRQVLRALSGDEHGGSSLSDVQKAFAALGLDLATSPHGGTVITWPALLDRLGHGGGAILLGDYSKLPRFYGRWDPRFWARLPSKAMARAAAHDKAAAKAAAKAKAKAKPASDHALYLDRYDSRTGRILVMDPLAPAGWTGEWIPVSALRAFAWHSWSGALSAAMTPPAYPNPFAGVRIGGPTYSASANTLRITWPIRSAPRGWGFSGARVVTTISRATPSTATGLIVSATAAATGRATRRRASVTGSRRAMTATVPLPGPGVYRVSVVVNDRRYGHRVKTTRPVTVYVPGSHWATYAAPSRLAAAAGGPVYVSTVVTNSGTVSWADLPQVPGLPYDVAAVRDAHLVGTWTPDPAPGAWSATPAGTAAPPPPVNLGPVALDPGAQVALSATISAPAAPGRWRLTLDVVDGVVGSYAATGSAPAVIRVDVGPSAEVTAQP